MLRNNPETTISGRVGTRGRIEYLFKAFGAVALLCIEMKPKVGNEKERLDAIGQVIAECDGKPNVLEQLPTSESMSMSTLGCDLSNTSRAFSLPILCILSDGLAFEFFKFKRSGSISSFFRGCFPGDPEFLRHGLTLPDPKTAESPLPFILQLRSICETIFDTMLNAYISALSAYRDRSPQGSAGKLKKPDFNHWRHSGKLKLSERVVILIPLIKVP